MKSTLSITLPSQIKNRLDRASKREHLPKGRIVRDALDQYFTMRDFERIRSLVVPKARKRGFLTDEDVFRAVS